MSQMNSVCVQVDRYEWRDGVTYFVGQRISYNVRKHRRAESSEHDYDERHEGVVQELWREPWRDTEFLYAEVIDTDDEPHRVWFHRDKVGGSGDMGEPPKDALF